MTRRPVVSAWLPGSFSAQGRGMRTGQKVLGLAEGKTAFDDLPQPTRPFYTGKPWFLPAAVGFYRWLDARQCRVAAAGA